MAEEWLTYAELGGRLGISAAAARHRVSRMNLRRQVGNDGRARVLVDLAELAFNPPQAPAERPPSTSSTPVERLDEVLREQVAFLQAELSQERGRSAELLNSLQALSARSADVEQAMIEALRERERADHLAGEVAGLARQLAKVAEEAGARERDLQVQLAEHMAEAERARAEAEKQAAVTREKADTLAAQLDLERHRAGELCQERDQVLERLDRAVERLNQVQAEHHAEVMAVREQMARAEHDHHRAAAELAAHLALPWWRRLFA